VVQQPAFARGRSADLDLLTKPFVVLNRAVQEIERYLSNVASGVRGKAIQLCFQFRWNMEIHEFSLEAVGEPVNALCF
jgi:hypothetical protein